MKSIIILSGPVGAGKSTVSKGLVAVLPEPLVYMEGDVFWSFIAKGADSRKRFDNFKIIMRSMTAAALPFAVSGYDVLLDFSIPPWYLDTVRAIAKLRDIPLDYVVLRPSEAVCAARAANRREGMITDYTMYHDLYTDFDALPQYLISDDTSDPDTMARRIRADLTAGRFRLT